MHVCMCVHLLSPETIFVKRNGEEEELVSFFSLSFSRSPSLHSHRTTATAETETEVRVSVTVENRNPKGEAERRDIIEAVGEEERERGRSSVTVNSSLFEIAFWIPSDFFRVSFLLVTVHCSTVVCSIQWSRTIWLTLGVVALTLSATRPAARPDTAPGWHWAIGSKANERVYAAGGEAAYMIMEIRKMRHCLSGRLPVPPVRVRAWPAAPEGAPDEPRPAACCSALAVVSRPVPHLSVLKMFIET
jgi:hypothetical protein